MVLYQVCSNGGPRVQNGPGAGGLGFETKKYLKIFFSRTAWLRCLKFGMKHCLVVLYQVCSNGGPRVQNGPGAGGLGFETKKYLKIFFSRTAWLRCLKFGMKHCLVVLYQVCSNGGPRVQNGPGAGGLGFRN